MCDNDTHRAALVAFTNRVRLNFSGPPEQVITNISQHLLDEIHKIKQLNAVMLGLLCEIGKDLETSDAAAFGRLRASIKTRLSNVLEGFIDGDPSVGESGNG